MARKEKPEAPPPDPEKTGIDGNRRALFRAIFNPLAAVTGAKAEPQENEGVILSKNPPQTKKVLRAGANAEVLALLGPLARGEAPGGYRLQRVTVREAEIHILFSQSTGPRREDLKNVLVSLTALESTSYQARWTTTSFRVCCAGDAPEADVAMVTEKVAREVAKGDRGHLWVVAAAAPRIGDDNAASSGYANLPPPAAPVTSAPPTDGNAPAGQVAPPSTSAVAPPPGTDILAADGLPGTVGRGPAGRPR